ncbi:hypothetical protein [Nocardioides bizhenqiangii]|uniref:Uncharacterized protein n=1 Tax=Nocardioides bizhenqiangii TaxID=3095076 RepID=A0ABZ0ZXI2_9ACTN|nr:MULTISPECIES: hypothetical protein [unclassified Nocardioides]MDZ5622167.1 hypothetical protein [Nocardioides sp. HM23]WQQ28654.1 hypothetical protein SHK19_10570 [Nocardioides sp. HM61]
MALGHRAAQKGDVMHRVRITRVLTVMGAAATVAVLSAVPVAADPSWSESFVDEFDDVSEDWCGVEGLDVRVVGTAQGWEGFKSGGKGPLDYFHSKVKIDEVHIAPTGVETRFTANVVDKDSFVVETESTFEIDALATGNATLYGPDGKAIARDPGQIRFHLSVDKETGEETFTLLRESTGRTDDFCAAELAAFGVALS